MLPYGVENALGGNDDDEGGNNAVTPLERARLFLAAVLAERGRFDALAAPGLNAVAFWRSSSNDSDSENSTPTLRCELPLSRALTNRYGSLHGGAAATLVDVCSSAAIAALVDRPGVSLSLSTHYHRPVVPLGNGGGGGGDDDDGTTTTVVVVDSHVVKVGKHVAAVEVAIRTRARGGGGIGGGGGGSCTWAGDRGAALRAAAPPGAAAAAATLGPVLVSGTHVKALVARSDVGALFEAAAAAASRAGARPPRSRL